MDKSELIEVDYDGIKLRGYFNHRTVNDIKVTMLSPYPNETRGIHRLNLALPLGTFKEPLGYQRGQELLIDIYNKKRNK